jgi:GntR family transcriptional regulator, arabinose operon transcriptional repressor
MTAGPNHTPKYQQVFEKLALDINSGKYKPGHKLPSEAALVRQFGTSRITVGRAVRELKERGLVERIAGSGTYVRTRATSEGGALFGLLIPDLGESEIFEPICQGMARAPEAGEHALLWGNTRTSSLSKEEQAWELCQQYIARRVSGVFFAPLELSPNAEVNHRILAALDRARIPVVLLDRCVLAYPQRSSHDLIGIDNRRAGAMITEHLLNLGWKRIAFVAYPQSAPTVEARIAGYREALFVHGDPVDTALVERLDPADANEIKRVMQTLHPQAFVCANDRTAGHLMHSLIALGHRIPEDVRIGGIDDVEYASLLPVPLTTIRQPCREIGQVAMAAMLERVARPETPVREILLDCKLVVRQSCGAGLGSR